jgi:hypothetical protein
MIVSCNAQLCVFFQMLKNIHLSLISVCASTDISQPDSPGPASKPNSNSSLPKNSNKKGHESAYTVEAASDKSANK